MINYTAVGMIQDALELEKTLPKTKLKYFIGTKNLKCSLFMKVDDDVDSEAL